MATNLALGAIRMPDAPQTKAGGAIGRVVRRPRAGETITRLAGHGP
jgi:hypothetical protein